MCNKCRQHSDSKNEEKRESKQGLWFNIFHHNINYNHRDWGAHGSSIELSVEGATEGKVDGIQVKVEQGDYVVSHQ